jgi:hypothetical protein
MKKAVLVISLILVLTGMASLLLAESHPDYKEAMNYFYQKDYKRAVELLKAYVDQRPEAQAYYRLGYALYELGKYSEAEEYFREAYVIDPEYSPEIAPQVRESLKWQGISVEPSGAGPPIIRDPSASAAPGQQPVLTDQKKAFEGMTPGKPEEAVKSLESLQPEQAPEAITPQQPAAPPAPTAKTTPPPIPGAEQLPPELQEAFEETMKRMPIKPGEGMPQMDTFEGPFPMPEGMGKIMALVMPFMFMIGLIMIFLQILWVICHYFIAKKLNVTAAWIAFLAFTPLILNVLGLIGSPESLANFQGLFIILGIVVLIAAYVGYHWPVVSSAGKPWWWMIIPIPLAIVSGLFMLIPLIGFFISIILMVGFYVYLYMCIAENLGKNRNLGLLMALFFLLFIPPLILVVYLAFSKTDSETDAFEAARLA